MAKTGTGKFGPVADALRAQITGGQLGAGEWLPSEAAIMDQYDVSRYTAREAIKRLVGEGLIVVVDGKGAYVRPRRERAAHADVRAVHTDIGPDGTVVYRDPDVGDWQPVEEPGRYRTVATDDLALTMGVPEHTPVFVYDRLLAPAVAADQFGARGAQRRIFHRLYLLASACAGIDELANDPFRIPDQLYEILAENGAELRWVEHVRAIVPTPDDAASLHIRTGSAVLVTRRVVTRADGRPVAMEETRRNADDTQLTYPLTPTSQ